jgi:hypothetical protein
MIRTLAMLILFSFIGQAQTPSNKVPVSFKVDGKKQAVSYKVKFSLDGKVIEPSYVEGGFIIPPIFTSQELDDKKRVGIKMILDDKEINFSGDTPIRAFTIRYAKDWLIDIDNKPFEPAVLPSGAMGEYFKEHSQYIGK